MFCADLMQAKCDELERQGVLHDPKNVGVDVRVVSPAFIQQKARARNKPLHTCTLDEIRFISSFNLLNKSIHAVPGRTSMKILLNFWAAGSFTSSLIFRIVISKSRWIKIFGVTWQL